ncbi:type III polyketide synthase [Meiothermus granaticius]|uniref:1,3,6,8-tetrahydroxynaphthalene synthase n=1 Tax=Meiothermus granaticius NBRC 107808 TaxID=1227551 RepID=A0A399F763_9DEIN|nr:stilbene synthase [Meiothermus granaticius]MCL6525926.1 stilbene synthase [Thermaceae bacterium]RIH91575.1 1,3,6,8-tetrahydroxynaphthalene synthase [Meiothermus granaticius NBRC 107808]GEM85440.1 chalcone synthase [Meiothermus granaticius NBRC 107808]
MIPTSPSPNPRLLGIGTAVPPYRIGQAEAKGLAERLFEGLPGLHRLLGVFEHTGIETRYLSAPLEWFAQEHSFAEKNALWADTALTLSIQASQAALAQAEVAAEQIAAVVWVSTTGIATPSLEAYLVQRLGIPLSAVRLPIWGLGCAGGVAGLSRSAELARLYPNGYVLLVAVELCSLTFVRGDLSKSNLVASSLFADGAAAVVLGPGKGPEVRGGFSRLLPQSYGVMGWDVTEGGLQVRFAQSIPELVRGELGRLIGEGLEGYALDPETVGSWALHPGGAKVLAAYREALGIDARSLEASGCVLKTFGNMSSPTALFVLQRLMSPLEPLPADTPGVVLALGPGFAVEGTVLQW